MADRYDFANLSPVEFESLSVDLVSAETGLRFERFSEGTDEGMDGRHSRAEGDIILQAKHYKNSSWADLKTAAKSEAKNLSRLDPNVYFFVTSQRLTPDRKRVLASLLNHGSVDVSNIWGRAELNALLSVHPAVERRNIKLWLTSITVLQRLLTNEIAVFTQASRDDLKRILKVYVANPSLARSAEILKATHCLIVSGPPGVGKTTLAQVLAAEYSDEGWETIALSSISDGFKAMEPEGNQVFVFDDFLGTIKLDPASLARDDGHIVRFMSMIRRDKSKRFILTTRSYLLEAARVLSEAIDDTNVEVSEMILDLGAYTREHRARILYNHLYHSGLNMASVDALLVGSTVRNIIDHPNYMPRIIHWMTDEFRQHDVMPEEYPRAFIEALNDPAKIWDKAFRRHITEPARILLYCLYFAEQETYINSVALDALRVFFERAVVNFGAVTKAGLRKSLFEDTLREVKSSFILVDDGRVKFINPSIQDYLSRETADPTVLAVLAGSVSTTSGVLAIWKRIDNHARAAAARTLLNALIKGTVSGKVPLDQLAKIVGELILATGELDYCERLRKDSVKQLYWFSEGQLPLLVDELESGAYREFPFARIYARYLRRQIHSFVSTERDEPIDIGDLADVASALASAGIQMSSAFYKLFEEAAEEAIDAISPDKIGEEDDPEYVIEGWLDEIEKIENIVPRSIAYWKKDELEDRLSAILHLREQQERREELGRAEGASGAFDNVRGEQRGFSNADIDSMFSSLRG